jgi:hypothetical protein
MAGENRVSLSHSGRTSGSRPYIRCGTSGYTSGHEIVCPLQRLLGKTSFSLHSPPILRLLRPIKAT